MTICRKCGREIPDGQELCEECMSREANSGESYLDELIQDVDNEAQSALQSVPKAKSEAEMLEEELAFALEPELETAEEEEPEPEEAEEEEPEPESVEEEPAFALEPELETAEEEESEPEEEEPEPESVEEEPVFALEPELETAEEEEPEPESVEEEPEPESVEEEPAFALEPEIETAEEEESGPEAAEEEPELVAMEEPEASSEDDINELLNLLSREDSEDFDESELEEDEGADEPEAAEEKPEPVVMPEVSLFSDDDDDIFTDGQGMTSVDDVFQDALSAVSYSEKEQEEGLADSDDIMAFDSLALDETDSDSQEEEESPVKEIKGKKLKPAKEKKKDSFWKRIFGNIITENTREEEEKERELERASEEERLAAKEEQKQKAAEEKAAKAEQAQQEKERKASIKAEKAAEKAAAKEEKKRIKAELEATEVVGKINPVGATIVIVFFGLICIAVVLGTISFSYSRAVKNAQKEFDGKNYQAAYDAIAGVKVSEASKEMEEKVRICMQLQKELNSYDNYYKMRMYLEALDSLVKGIRMYDTNLSKADEYEILTQYNELESQIAGTLYDEFGVGESEARNIIALEDQEAYTKELEEIINRWEEKGAEDER